jgi:hypothetical protein
VVGAIGTNGDGFGGGAEDWAQALAEWHRRLRLDCYIFWPTLDERHQLDRFANDVIPRVRDLIRHSCSWAARPRLGLDLFVIL